MTAKRPGSRSGSWPTWLKVFLIATVLAGLATIQQYALTRFQGESAGLGRLLALTTPFWYLWALLAPVVQWLGRRVPIERPGAARRIAFHLAMAGILSVLHSSMHAGILLSFWWLFRAPEGGLLRAVVAFNWLQFSLNLVAYAALLGISLARGYYRRFRERELAATQLEAQLAQARLAALRMQLDPHFLFNAMNTIAMLVRKRDNPGAVKMLAGLSDLLRYVLEESRQQEVPLGDEIDFIKKYLAIEQVRFGQRLRVEFHVDDNTLEAHVPNLILQPLVENAVRHGVANRPGRACIIVQATRENETLRMEVLDDGTGLSHTGDHRNGVGLSNTRARLTQLYAENHRFNIADRDDRGVVATVEIPFKTTPSRELL